MKIKESQALEIAKNFALSQYKDTSWPLNINDTSIKLRYGAVFGMSDPHWTVIISTRTNNPDIAVFDPDHVIVMVDSESGEAKWFPVM